jgi:hypothetical protein
VPENLYRFAPVFLVRMAGLPFEILEQIATTTTIEAARQFIGAEREFSNSKLKVEEILSSRRHNLSKEQFRAWRKAILHGVMPPVNDAPSAAFAECWEAASRFAETEALLNESLNRELTAARIALDHSGRRHLPAYLVFAGTGLVELITAAAEKEPLPPRNKSLRNRERHVLLYLQRLCAKNDTLSEFGPHGWGIVRSGARTIELDPRPGVCQREIFLERWTAHGVVEAINADAETAPEIAPYLHSAGSLRGNRFVFTDTGRIVEVDSELRALLEQCDGSRAAHSLGDASILRRLSAEEILKWEMNVPALDPYAFRSVANSVANWRDTPVRDRWLNELRIICDLAERFGRERDVQQRHATIDAVRQRLKALGVEKSATRFLYSAANPIGEECFRELNVSITPELMNEVAHEAAPWIDLWRDSYAFIAGRVATGLRTIFDKAPVEKGAVPLPLFLRLCAEAKLPLSGAGMVALAHLAFREVKEAFRERLSPHAGECEYNLSPDDCHIVRQNFDYPKFDEFTYPSADLQLAATSVEAVRRGDYQWIIAELHPPIALLHHGFYWSCPDKQALGRAIEQTCCGKPCLYYGYFAADFTATTTVRLDALSDSVKFVAPEKSVGPWEKFRPGEVEVFVDETGDIGVRTRDSRRYLGSFARGWVIPLGFHPFSFSLGAHTPRLLCGKVIVQRESWTLTANELGKGDYTGVSRDLVVAIEKLRAAHGLPRFVYIRPTEQALRRSGVEGRDKDTKPVFVDLESYLFLEIFHRWLTKAGELEVTEMLPAPEHLLWQEEDGRHTFELRTQIVPG